MKDLLTEFRREILKSMQNLADDGFYTKEELSNLINKSYGRAKKQCESSEAISLEDE